MQTFETLRQTFAEFVPDMERMAKARFRDRDPESREEAVQNVLGLAWKHFRALIEQGKAHEPGLLRSCLWYAIKQTRAGRLPQGLPKAKDAHEAARRGKAGFQRVALDSFIGKETAPPDAASFHIDIPAFLSTLSDRQQRIALDLASGMTTKAASDTYKVSQASISQFRRRVKESLEAYLS